MDAVAPDARPVSALDGSRYRVDALDPANSGDASAGHRQPERRRDHRAVEGRPSSTLNAGTGFPQQQRARHDDHARPSTASRSIAVTPLVRAKGAEVGVRTVAVPHLQSTVSLWTLRLGSELVYNGDVGATEPGPASERHGVEFANYYSPLQVADLRRRSLAVAARASREYDPAGQFVPEAVGTVVSAGASVDGFHRTFGSLRLALLRTARAGRRTTRCGRRRRAS